MLYIGDSKYDSKCAENAGIDFALAVWGSHNKHIKADYILERPAICYHFREIVLAMKDRAKMTPTVKMFAEYLNIGSFGV